MSINRAPEADLAPWIARIYATKVDTEPDNLISCGLVADTSVLRVLLGGNWHAETRDGPRLYEDAALFFGPQSKRMPVSVRGSFATVGVALKPGATEALGGPPLNEALDRIIYYDDLFDEEWGTSAQMIEWFGKQGPPERWLRVAEKLFTFLVERAEGKKPHPIVEAFDCAAFANPNLVISDFAEDHGISNRSLERLIKRAFGQSPKQVLRRARALDMAARLRGVADEAEADELALRFYDQSHLIREFTAFFGMTPMQFVRTPQPLMTLTLEARQARRLETLNRVAPGQPMPWDNQADTEPEGGGS